MAANGKVNLYKAGIYMNLGQKTAEFTFNEVEVADVYKNTGVYNSKIKIIIETANAELAEHGERIKFFTRRILNRQMQEDPISFIYYSTSKKKCLDWLEAFAKIAEEYGIYFLFEELNDIPHTHTKLGVGVRNKTNENGFTISFQ